MIKYVIKTPFLDAHKNILHCDLLIATYTDHICNIEKYMYPNLIKINTYLFHDVEYHVIRRNTTYNNKIIRFHDITDDDYSNYLIFADRADALISKAFLVNELRKTFNDKDLFDKTVGYNAEKLCLKLVEIYPEYII